MPVWDKTVSGTRRLTRLALLTALSLILFVVEQQIPLPIAIPGVKLGLANVVSLFTLYAFSRREAAAVLGVRILLGNLVCGSVSAMLYAAAGGAACLAVLCALRGLIPPRRAWVLGILSAMAHILGQMAVAVAILGTSLVLAYLPVLLLSAMVTGAFTGTLVTLVLDRLGIRSV